MAVEPKPQVSIFDKVIEDETIEAALEERQALKQSAGEASKLYRDADTAARAALEKVPLDGPVRIGRFIIAKSKVAPRSVSFETSETHRLSIKPIDEP